MGKNIPNNLSCISFIDKEKSREKKFLNHPKPIPILIAKKKKIFKKRNRSVLPLPCHIHSVSNSRTRREIVRSLIWAPPLLTSSQLTVHATTATMMAKQIAVRIHMILVALFFLAHETGVWIPWHSVVE